MALARGFRTGWRFAVYVSDIASLIGDIGKGVSPDGTVGVIDALNFTAEASVELVISPLSPRNGIGPDPHDRFIDTSDDLAMLDLLTSICSSRRRASGGAEAGR